MDTFHHRSHFHDKIAIPYVQEQLAKYDLKGIPYGVEVHDPDLQRALMLLGRQNKMALRDRYKPDLYIVPQPEGMKINPSVPPLLCEVKNENGARPNFAVEFDSFCAAKIWDNGQKNVIYIFVKMGQDTPIEAKACWVSSIYFRSVLVPRRFDFEKNISELEEGYPQYRFEPVGHTGGSGTPYFLIRQEAIYLKPFDLFITETFGLSLSNSVAAQLTLF